MKTRIQNTAAFAPSTSRSALSSRPKGSGLRRAKEDRRQRAGSAIFLIVGVACIFFWLGAVDAKAQSIEFDGLIEPKLTANMGSSTPGILESVTVDRGDMVKEGQVVATLQAGVEKSTMELAKARAELDATIKAKKGEMEFAERSKQRKKELYEKKTLSFQEWDEAETRRMLAELALNEALEAKRLAELEYKRSVEVVKRMSIRSPVTGVVVERYLHPGEYIEDKPVMKLAQVDPLHVEVIMPVSMLGSVKLGMRAQVKPEAPVGGVYGARVTIVDKVVDAASGTFGVRLELPNPDYKLPPGLKCKVLFLNP
jgi:RND family efflux transporter MFP subunit